MSLHEFVKYFWDVIERVPFADNWSVGAICEFLEALANREFLQGMISIPPRRSKSTLVNVMFPAWVWGENAGLFGTGEQFFCISYAESLIKRDSVKCRKILESAKFRLRYHDRVEFLRDQNEKLYYVNTENGYRDCSTVKGQGTGKGGSALMFDDPISAEDVRSQAERENVQHYWSHTLSTRVNDPQTTFQLLIGQRLHKEDPSGHILNLEGDEWTHLCIPNEYRPDRHTVLVWRDGKIENLVPHDDKYSLTSEQEIEVEIARAQGTIFFEDPRKEHGELMWPSRFGDTERSRMKRRLGGDYAAQFQQQPSNDLEAVFKPWWWRFWLPSIEWDKGDFTEIPRWTTLLPDHESIRREGLAPNTLYTHKQKFLPSQGFDLWVQSWDTKFKDEITESKVCGQVWARKGVDLYLIDQVLMPKAGIIEVMKAIREFARVYPSLSQCLIEERANGASVIQMLRGKVAGLIAVNPYGGKLSRANAAQGPVQGGNVYIPHPFYAPWSLDFMEALKSVPSDEMDAATQTINRIARSTSERGEIVATMPRAVHNVIRGF